MNKTNFHMKGIAFGLALKQRRKANRKLPITQFKNHEQRLKLIEHSGGPLLTFIEIRQQKLPEFGFRTHTTALWPMEQSPILSAKFDRPVGRPQEVFTF